MALERQLNETGLTMLFRNIWEDPDAAAFVRSHADGNEIVPTAVSYTHLTLPTILLV